MSYSEAIRHYHQQLGELQANSRGSEGELRHAFQCLLDASGGSHNMLVIAETTQRAQGSATAKIRYDGKVMRRGSIMAHGYWEAKGPKADLLRAAEDKRQAGYNFSNLLLENTQQFLLYQDEALVYEGSLQSAEQLSLGLQRFYGYENQREEEYRQALLTFKSAIPSLAAELRASIAQHSEADPKFAESVAQILAEFSLYNSGITPADVHEFIVQHVLTIDLFRRIFEVQNFTDFNPIAKLLNGKIMAALGPQYSSKISQKIGNLLRLIGSEFRTYQHSPQHKQQILISIYEEFFKAYNPAKADTHGIVYTPPQIVRFMLRSCDHLMHQHFGRRLADQGVRILDPCTGTGTFICQLFELFTPRELRQKYRDVYAIEIDVMAYYMAQMNIDAALRSRLPPGAPAATFGNLALADTLELATVHPDSKKELFATYAGMTEHNAQLVKDIQDSDFLLILGNPPYNAAQHDENDNNRNKRYPVIDARSKQTYGQNSSAQKQKNSDMYIRFLRWASDKLLYKHSGTEEGDALQKMAGPFAKNGRHAMLCFITNRSYIDKLFTDGLRKTWGKEWDNIYVLDLGGDLRQAPKNSAGQLKGNVFNIQTGVAICWLLRDLTTAETAPATIHYYALEDYQSGPQKLQQLHDFEGVHKLLLRGHFMTILPDEKGNWLQQGERHFSRYISMGDKQTKRQKVGEQPSSIFTLYSNGVNTARDQWVYDFSRQNLQQKLQFFIAHYEQKRRQFWGEYSHEQREEILHRNAKSKLHTDQKALQDWLGAEIKWSRDLRDGHFSKNHAFAYSTEQIITGMYRPFVAKYFYYDHGINDVLTQKHDLIFGANGQLPNICICTTNAGSSKDFHCLASDTIVDLHFVGDSMIFPRYRYAAHSRADLAAGRLPRKIDNITDHAMQHFHTQLQAASVPIVDPSSGQPLDKNHIFAYCYGLLQQRDYCAQYAANLRLELPRLPVRPDFWDLAAKGRQLLHWHLHWRRASLPEQQQLAVRRRELARPKYILKSRPEQGCIAISDGLTIEDVPRRAWDYQLGGRSAIDWVLEFYRASKNRYKDGSLLRLETEGGAAPILQPYSVALYQEQLLEILQLVVAVSVATVDLLAADPHS